MVRYLYTIRKILACGSSIACKVNQLVLIRYELCSVTLGPLYIDLIGYGKPTAVLLYACALRNEISVVYESESNCSGLRVLKLFE